MKSRRRKNNSGWWGLGVIAVGLIFFCLFFRVVTFNNDKVRKTLEMRERKAREFVEESQKLGLTSEERRKRGLPPIRELMEEERQAKLALEEHKLLKTYSNDFTIVAKKHPTFSNTFVNLEDLIKRYNKAIEEYNDERFNPARSPFETYLRNHAVDPTLCEEFYEKGLMAPKEDIANTKVSPSLPKLVVLGAEKSIPDKLMAPILEELKHEYEGTFRVTFIDAREHPDEAKKYNIKMIPTQIFYDADGNELFRHAGFYSKEDILNKWKEFGIWESSL